MYTLYSAPTPNGHKASIMLEELGVPYELRALDLGKLEQKEPSFLAINPNGRIPALIDHQPSDGGGDFAVFESGAILLYLADKHQQLLPADPRGRSEVTQWLMFQMAGVGPMMGQANVFFRYAPEKIPYAIDRYQRESRRLLEVLDGRLRDRSYIAGDYSIADIALWPWVNIHGWSGVSIEGLAALQRWLALVGERPAVQRGLLRPPKPAPRPEAAAEQASKILA